MHISEPKQREVPLDTKEHLFVRSFLYGIGTPYHTGKVYYKYIFLAKFEISILLGRPILEYWEGHTGNVTKKKKHV